MSNQKNVEVFFWSGRDRWTGRPRAAKTIWRDGEMIDVEPTDKIPESETAIPVKKSKLEQLLRTKQL
jgi:hypothetical protein